MKEYVEVSSALLKKTKELKRYFDASYAYVGSLKPKPTTRKKKATTVGKKTVDKKRVEKKTARKNR